MTTTPAQSWLERNGATPGKLALIGVLALILGYVIISQLPGKKPAAISLRTAPPLAGVASPQTNQADPLTKAPQRKAWPKLEVSQAVVHDPFAAPPWAQSSLPPLPQASSGQPVASSSNSVDVLAELKESGATAVVMVNGERLALVGDARLRVGDRLKGFRVVDITQAGVVLADEKESP